MATKKQTKAGDEDYKIKIRLDTSESTEKLRDLEALFKSVKKLASQVGNVQKGWASTKQVNYARSLRSQSEEIMSSYKTKHTSLEASVRTAADNVVNNSNPGMNDHLDREYNRARARRDISHTRMREAQAQHDRSTEYHDSLGSARESNFLARGESALAPLSRLAPFGGIYGVGQYINNSMSTSRSRQAQAAKYGTKMGAYGSNFGGLNGGTVQDLGTVGKPNGYDSQETLDTASTLISQQGTSGDKNKTNLDIQSIQRFGRGHGVDPNLLASAGGALSQMGAVREGDQRRFADLLAGSIKKTNMNGREEELIRSTVSLAQQVGSSMTKMSPDQLGNIVSAQTILGQNNSTLKGAPGASLLSSVDAGIKSGDNLGNLLSGLGTDPQYQGIAGYQKLQIQRQKGISDPKNFKTIYDNVKKVVGGNTPEESVANQQMLLAQQFGLTDQQDKVKTLWDNGTFDKLASQANDPTAYAKTLASEGLNSTNKTGNAYDNSVAGQQARNKAQSIVRADTAGSFFGNIGTSIMGGFNELPTIAQLGIAAGVGIGGSSIASRVGIGAMRSVMGSQIPEGMSARGALSSWARSPRGGFQAPWTDPHGVAQPGNPMATGVRGIGGNIVRQMGPSAGGGYGAIPRIVRGNISEFASSGLTGGVKAVGKNLLRKAPVLGTAIGAGFDIAEGNSLAKTLFMGAGSLVGGALGGVATGAAGVGTGGAGLLAGGVLVGGGAATGHKIAKETWNLGSKLFGSKSSPVDPSNVSDTDPSNAEVKTVTTDKLIVNSQIKDMSSTNPSSKDFSSKVGTGNATPNVQVDHKVIVNVSGNSGFSAGENTKVATGITDYITNFNQSRGGYNLSRANALR